MYKNLCPSRLGISGRQSEIIELTLTHGFRGLDIEIGDFSQRAKSQGLDQAVRFLNSAKIEIGSVDLPVRWRGDAETYRADLADLDQVAAYAAEANVHSCKTVVFPESDQLPYHENFEQHRTRIAEIAEVLAKHGLKLAVGFQAAESRRDGKQFQFIQEADALALLLKSVNADNAGLWLDTWDWYVGGGTVESLKDFGVSNIIYITIADAPADVDRASLTEEQRTLPAVDGATNLAEIVKLLTYEDYRGPITLAPNPECFTGMKNDNILKQCSSALDDIGKTVEPEETLVAAGSEE
jgi:sugar phosphate isomerase/epimerase